MGIFKGRFRFARFIFVLQLPEVFGLRHLALPRCLNIFLPDQNERAIIWRGRVESTLGTAVKSQMLEHIFTLMRVNMGSPKKGGAPFSKRRFLRKWVPSRRLLDVWSESWIHSMPHTKCSFWRWVDVPQAKAQARVKR